VNKTLDALAGIHTGDENGFLQHATKIERALLEKNRAAKPGATSTKRSLREGK